jgi:hypothetical protein
VEQPLSTRDALMERLKGVSERGERLGESTIPHGIGPAFLESQGPGLHPEVRAQLQARELKKDQIRILYTQIHEIREKRVELGQPANESQWKLWGEVETERIREDTRVSRRARPAERTCRRLLRAEHGCQHCRGR